MAERTVSLELPFPPGPDLADRLREAIDATIPVGERLAQLVNMDHIGPDLDDNFDPCYRVSVTYGTTEVDPQLWEGDDG